MILFSIARKELLGNLVNLRILIAYAVIFILVIFSVVVKGMQLSARTDEYYANTARFKKDFEKKLDPESDDWYVWDYDVQIMPRRLALFCEGFNREISRPFHVGVKPMKALGDFVFENPIFMVYRVYDPVFVIAFLVSLLAIFISYDTVSRERESGTLKLVLANGFSKSTFILGKFLGGYLSLLVPLATAYCAALITVLVGFGLQFTAADLLLAGILALLCSLYLAVLFFVSTFFSILFRRAATAMFFSILAWFLLAFAWPFLSLHLARSITPVRYLGGMAQAYSNIKTEEAIPREKEQKKVEEEHDNDAEMMRLLWTRYHQRVNARWAETLREQRNALMEQMTLGMTLARFSPVSSFIFCASNIAGTGLYNYLDAWEWKDNLRAANKKAWDDEAERRRKMFAHLPPKERDAKAFVRMDYDISQLPSRDYPGLGLKETAANSLPEVLALILTALLMFFASYFIFIRQTDNN